MDAVSKPSAIKYYSSHVYTSFLRIMINLEIKLNKPGATGIKRKFSIIF